VRDLLEILPHLDFHALVVTNEVGSAIVPENALARGFRDLAGSVNQRLAAVASEVVLWSPAFR
jgi:adenosylcobinamide kinase/adenosylcobinamide-phosphate guanylyltransferase